MVKNKFFAAVLIAAVLSFSFVYSQENSNATVDQSDDTVVENTAAARTPAIDETIFKIDDSSNSSGNNTENKTSKSPSATGTIVRAIIALVVVIFLLYWLLKIIRKKTNVVKDEDDFLRRAAYLNVGTGNKTVEVITLIDRAYVIAVADGEITLLDEIKDDNERDKDLIQAMNLNADKKQKIKKPVKFSEVLDMFTRKNAKSSVAEKKTKKSLFNSSERTLDEMLKKANSDNTEE